MTQRFYCPKCSTIFEEDSSNWIFVKRITCPFCLVTWPVKVNTLVIQGYSRETIQLSGDLDAEETEKLD